jgi:hypothetical protein
MTKSRSDDKASCMRADTVKFIENVFDIPSSSAFQDPSNTLNRMRCNEFSESKIRKTLEANSSKPDPTLQSQTRPKKTTKGSQQRRGRTLKRKQPESSSLHEWSAEQQRCIDRVRCYLEQVTVWHAKGQESPPPPPPCILILGGPGSGKSALTRELNTMFKEHNLSSLSCAMMAVAASNMSNASTIHSMFNFSVDRSKKKNKKREKNTFLKRISSQQMRIFRSRIEQGLTDGTPIATFIDEVSMLTPVCLGQILGRYRHPDLTDFKQGAFILVGDMWQVFKI